MFRWNRILRNALRPSQDGQNVQEIIENLQRCCDGGKAPLEGVLRSKKDPVVQQVAQSQVKTRLSGCDKFFFSLFFCIFLSISKENLYVYVYHFLFLVNGYIIHTGTLAKSPTGSPTVQEVMPDKAAGRTLTIFFLFSKITCQRFERARLKLVTVFTGYNER